MSAQAQIKLPSPARHARFITLEGVDGAGKSTHVQWMADHIAGRGISVITTREPGGTPVGERLRDLLLHEDMHLATETLLMFAARNEHLETLIKPALEAGTWVVCDRFTDATYAYQGGGRQLGADRVQVLEAWVHDSLQPDCTFLFDVPLSVAHERLHRGRELDRFEHEQVEFFERTRAAYLQRAENAPDRFRIVDATGAISDTRAMLRMQLNALIDATISGSLCRNERIS